MIVKVNISSSHFWLTCGEPIQSRGVRRKSHSQTSLILNLAIRGPKPKTQSAITPELMAGIHDMRAMKCMSVVQ
jgi:hypothetical protein